MTPDDDIPTFLALVAAFSATLLVATVVGVVWVAGRWLR